MDREPARLRCTVLRMLTATSLAALPLAAASPALAALETGPCAVEKQADVPATMRDGTVLLADVYRPREPGTYPVLLMRLPYDKDAAQTYVYAKPEAYASHCYIVVIQDVRGQYTSEGEFYPFRDEAADGYDTVEWAAALPGSSGKVGMYGFSYVGATQWLAATQKPPHLAAIAPAHTSSDYYDGWSYEGGAFSLAFLESWPLTSIAAVRLPPPRRPGGPRPHRARRRASCRRPTSTCRSRTIPGCSRTARMSRPTSTTGSSTTPGTTTGSSGASAPATATCRCRRSTSPAGTTCS